MLVDRYKYLDLFPCTPLELKIMGYVVSHITTKISQQYYSVNRQLSQFCVDLHDVNSALLLNRDTCDPKLVI